MLTFHLPLLERKVGPGDQVQVINMVLSRFTHCRWGQPGGRVEQIWAQVLCERAKHSDTAQTDVGTNKRWKMNPPGRPCDSFCDYVSPVKDAFLLHRHH
jgi:hypothetical protein